jgi:hypothetical protein
MGEATYSPQNFVVQCYQSNKGLSCGMGLINTYHAKLWYCQFYNNYFVLLVRHLCTVAFTLWIQSAHPCYIQAENTLPEIHTCSFLWNCFFCCCITQVSSFDNIFDCIPLVHSQNFVGLTFLLWIEMLCLCWEMCLFCTHASARIVNWYNNYAMDWITEKLWIDSWQERFFFSKSSKLSLGPTYLLFSGYQGLLSRA